MSTDQSGSSPPESTPPGSVEPPPAPERERERGKTDLVQWLLFGLLTALILLGSYLGLTTGR